MHYQIAIFNHCISSLISWLLSYLWIDLLRGSVDSPLMEKGCKDVLKYEDLILQVTFNFLSAHSKNVLVLERKS